MKNIQASGAQVVVSGNPGCAIQLQHGSSRFGVPIEVVHPATLLRQAYDAVKK
jgi:glycolate oxidase iron-sulfur subunit